MNSDGAGLVTATSSPTQVTTLVIRRAAKRNALNHDVVDALSGALTVAVDGGARVVVITGEGAAFSAGADLSGATYDQSFLDKLRDLIRLIESAPIPIIAAVNGFALGAGLQLAMAADLRVLAPDALCGVPAAKIGVAVDDWTIRRLVSLTNSGVAAGVLIGAQPLDADTALRHGFANRIGDLAEAQAWAEQIATFAPLTLAHDKLVLKDDGAQSPAPQAHLDAMYAAWRSQDLQEARTARAEKRTPVFKGV